MISFFTLSCLGVYLTFKSTGLVVESSETVVESSEIMIAETVFSLGVEVDKKVQVLSRVDDGAMTDVLLLAFFPVVNPHRGSSVCQT